MRNILQIFLHRFERQTEYNNRTHYNHANIALWESIMKYQDKIRIFSQKQENQDTFKKSGKNQESNLAARPDNVKSPNIPKRH